VLPGSIQSLSPSPLCVQANLSGFIASDSINDLGRLVQTSVVAKVVAQIS
jgi:hypothetical protein